MTKRVEAKNKICRRLGVNLWGRAESPIVKRDYPPGEHGSKRRKIVRLRPAAGGQAEAQGLLRQHHRAAVPAGVSGGRAPARRHRRAHGRPARAPPRHGGLPAELRADRVRRAPVRQSRPCHGQRPAGDHPELSGARRRHDRGAREIQEPELVLGTIQQPERDVPDYLSVDFKASRAPSCASQSWPTCLIRCRWSRIW